VTRPPKPGTSQRCGRCDRHVMLCTCERDRVLRATLTVEPEPSAPEPPGVGPNAQAHPPTRPLAQKNLDSRDYR
jgi:hypothetical protein